MLQAWLRYWEGLSHRMFGAAGSSLVVAVRIAAHICFNKCFFETCRRNGVNPHEYITKTLEAILTKQTYKMPWELRDDPAATIIQ